MRQRLGRYMADDWFRTCEVAFIRSDRILRSSLALLESLTLPLTTNEECREFRCVTALNAGC
jgi:hypothetical protein